MSMIAVVFFMFIFLCWEDIKKEEADAKREWNKAERLHKLEVEKYREYQKKLKDIR